MLYAVLYTLRCTHAAVGSADQQVIELSNEVLVFRLRTFQTLVLSHSSSLPSRIVMLRVSLFKCFHKLYCYLLFIYIIYTTTYTVCENPRPKPDGRVRFSPIPKPGSRPDIALRFTDQATESDVGWTGEVHG